MGQNDPPMAIRGLRHGNCGLRYIGGIFQPIKLGFRGAKGQFDVKKANFRGLTAKIGYLRPILTSRDHLCPIFMDYATGIVA